MSLYVQVKLKSQLNVGEWKIEVVLGRRASNWIKIILWGHDLDLEIIFQFFFFFKA